MEDVELAQLGLRHVLQHPAQLRLKDDDQGQDTGGHHILHDELDCFHIQIVGYKIQQRQCDQAFSQLHCSGFADELDHLIDQHRNDRNIQDIPDSDSTNRTNDLVPLTYHSHHPFCLA